jgi:hypothetical protein
MRTRFHESATPRQLPPMTSTPVALRHGTDLARVVHRDLLGDDDDLLQAPG